MNERDQSSAAIADEFESGRLCPFPKGGSRYLLLCPTGRDRRELARVAPAGTEILEHEYASTLLESLVGQAPAAANAIGDPIQEIDRVLEQMAGKRLSGIISTDDYPGTTLAAVLAHALALPAPAPSANLLCQHKYYARIAQREYTPEAVPDFALIDVDRAPQLGAVQLPAMVKPVKSFFSIGAARVSSWDELAPIQKRWAGLGAFFRPFERLLEIHAGLRLGRGYLLAEDFLSGAQCTLEGYAYGGEIHVLGVIDSIMFPGTAVFSRFEYPSSLPQSAQHSMAEIARNVMLGLGYCDGLFNIEFMYNACSEQASIIEINPRMSSQFADLFEKVDGFNSYALLLDLATGCRPQPTWRRGRYAMAASCVLRTFEDQHVRALPSERELDRIAFQHPDIRIEVLGALNQRLSGEMQDGQSFRYGVINLGGRDRQDILATLRDCLQHLTFRLEPV